jgi:hypothetical protein
MKLKEWRVFHRYLGFRGTVWAERKYVAMAIAERDFKLEPGSFYVGAV